MGLRIFLQLISASLAVYLLDTFVSRIDLPVIDKLFSYPIFSFAFIVFAVVGITNSINIIDGFNGLAGGVSLIILFTLGYVAIKVWDLFVFSVCVSACGAILGFFVLNYPYGFIFLGDGGAYLIGSLIAILSIFLVDRNPQVFPWFPLLCVAYPFTETVFSVYRKKFLRNISPAKCVGSAKMGLSGFAYPEPLLSWLWLSSRCLPPQLPTMFPCRL